MFNNSHFQLVACITAGEYGPIELLPHETNEVLAEYFSPNDTISPDESIDESCE